MELNQPTAKFPDFFKQLDTDSYEMFVDNHMLSTFSTCPRMFYYKHIQNIRAKGGMPFYPAYGIWFHDVLEQFYEHLTEGFSVEQLFVIAAKLWSEADINRYATSDANRFEKMVGGYGNLTVGGLYSVPLSALTMVKQYYDTYYQLDREQWHIISVESGFGHEREVRLGTAYVGKAEIKIYYTGRPDLVSSDEGARVFPIDHKTTDQIRNGIGDRFKPHSETAGYLYAIRSITHKIADRCIINLCAREIPAQPRDKSKEPAPRFKRVYAYYTQEELGEWAHNAYRKCCAIATRILIESLPFDWEMAETQCFQYNSPCEYHQIDKVTPASRSVVIQANYALSDPWTPYQVKEASNA